MIAEQLVNSEKPVTVYIARNLANAKVYVGITVNFRIRKNKHKADTDRGSNNYFHRAIRKYGWDNFEWCILETVPTRVAASEIERYWISYFKSNDRTFGYNMTIGGEGAKGRVHSEESKKRMSEARKGITFSEEHKQNLSKAAKQRKAISEETRKKLSEIQKARAPESYDFLRGTTLSDETKKKISEANTGRIVSEEARRKISETLTGVPHTEERRKKVSEANTGKTHSEETRRKMSETHKARALKKKALESQLDDGALDDQS